MPRWPKLYPPKTPWEVSVTRQRRWQRRQQAKGKCIVCGSDGAMRGIFCEACYQKHLVHQRGVTAQRRKKKLCTRCGRPAARGYVSCLGCLRKARKARSAEAVRC